MADEQNDSKQPDWDHARAKWLIGKHVIIDITRLAPDETVLSQEPYNGLIDVADQRQGIKINCLGDLSGQVQWLPPHLVSFKDAKTGEYLLRSGGEVVIDPGVTSSWTISPPAN